MGADRNAGAYCLPQSATPITLIFPYKLIQTPDVIVHLTEFVTPGFRQIFLDGRGHPELWNPAWMGHSIGTWEGDTLVVETTGFNEITPGFGIHTEKLRVIERFTRPEFGRLEIEITAEDPDAYAEVFTFRREAGLVLDQEILEFVCAEKSSERTEEEQPANEKSKCQPNKTAKSAGLVLHLSGPTDCIADAAPQRSGRRRQLIAL